MRKSERNQKQNYQLLKKIGSGSYGKVFKAQTKSDKRVVAIKVIDIRNRKKEDIEQVLNEIRILFSISSSFIIDYYSAFVNESSTEFWIVMEYMPGGDLQKKIQCAKKQRVRISEKEIWKFFVQILCGIRDLNQRNIIHRDIKPANIFLSKDFKICKIGDMNVSKVLKNQLTSTQIGTPYYLPPEIWKNENYDIKCDIFSLGCLIYELATLKHPFEATSTNELQKKVLKIKTPDLPVYYSQELNLIVKKCLSKNPANRPTAQQLYQNSLFRKKIMEYGYQNFLDEDDQEFQYAEILETIIIPKKLSDLNGILPKKQLGSQDQQQKSFQSEQKKQYTDIISNYDYNSSQNYQIQKDEEIIKDIANKNDYSVQDFVPNIQQKYIDVIKQNQNEVIKIYKNQQKSLQKNQPKRLNSVKSIKNYGSQNKVNFNKKKNPSINFVDRNKKSVKQQSRRSSYSRLAINQERKKSKLRQQSLKKLSRNNSLKKSSSKNIKVNNSILKQKKAPPIKRKNSIKHKRLASLEGYYSNKEVRGSLKSQKQQYASNKNPPIRSQKQIQKKEQLPIRKKRLKSKSISNISRNNSTASKQKKEKAIKYGDYMKQVAQQQREKLKKRRSVSKKRKASYGYLSRN